MFASVNQMRKYKPTKVCDVFSLLCVCYYFIEDGLPWTDYADRKNSQNPNLNLYELETFKEMRIDMEEEFWD